MLDCAPAMTEAQANAAIRILLFIGLLRVRTLLTRRNREGPGLRVYPPPHGASSVMLEGYAEAGKLPKCCTHYQPGRAPHPRGTKGVTSRGHEFTRAVTRVARTFLSALGGGFASHRGRPAIYSRVVCNWNGGDGFSRAVRQWTVILSDGHGFARESASGVEGSRPFSITCGVARDSHRGANVF